MTAPHLIDCPRCRRHFFSTHDHCPFCKSGSRVEPGRVARFAMAAMTPMVLGACYGSARDSGYKGWHTGDSGSSGTTDITIGAINGTAGVFILETSCDVVWDMSGDQCAGCDLGWDVSLDDTGSGTCSADASTSGTFEVADGAAYFNRTYWGAATVGGGSVTWATAGYVYGADGYTYAYAGSATY